MGDLQSALEGLENCDIYAADCTVRGTTYDPMRLGEAEVEFTHNGYTCKATLDIADDEKLGKLQWALCNRETAHVNIRPVEVANVDVCDAPGAPDGLTAVELYRAYADRVELGGSEPKPVDDQTTPADCPECGGSGEVDLTIGPERLVDCQHCDGKGEVER